MASTNGVDHDRERSDREYDCEAACGHSVPPWTREEPSGSLAPLLEDAVADVCIVGAGIAGLTSAYLLTREGRSVIVVDDGAVGGGQTERTSAHLSNAIDDRYFEIERIHGAEALRLVAESHTAAIDEIERICAEEKIECAFARVAGYLFDPPGVSESKLLREMEAAHRAGLEDVQWLSRAPLDLYDTGPCLRFPDQAQFHPLRYLAGLTRALSERGARIHTRTHAASIESGSRPGVAMHTGATVKAGAVVVATNSPVNSFLAIHTKQAPYLTYVIAAEIERRGAERALYWDTGVPYHFVRFAQPDPSSGAEVILVGGEDHKIGHEHDAEERYARLEEWARERFGSMGAVRHRWSGQVLETADGLAYIGAQPGSDNVYIATGDSGMGLTHGTIAGMLLRDLITGQENPWTRIYDPSRLRAGAAMTYLRENLDVAARYADWLAAADADSADEIARDSGAIIRSGLRKVAVYRDQGGVLHEFSASCPHAGCAVNWNAAEKTWDCPCHGSRFDCVGQVLQGPANVDLRRLKPSAPSSARSAEHRTKRSASR